MSRPKVTFTWTVTFEKTRPDGVFLSPGMYADFEDAALAFARDFAQGRGLEPTKSSIKARYAAPRGKAP